MLSHNPSLLANVLLLPSISPITRTNHYQRLHYFATITINKPIRYVIPGILSLSNVRQKNFVNIPFIYIFYKSFPIIMFSNSVMNNQLYITSVEGGIIELKGFFLQLM